MVKYTGDKEKFIDMGKDLDIKKVLVIGSGPIVIGQAAEFDYSGTQGCKALKAEGVEIVLINSNPATIMTDTNIADRIYLEPLTVDSIKKIIIKEEPDSILPTLGGQTALNLAMELAEEGFLERHNVKLLATSIDTIKRAEDRDEFKKTMMDINEPIIDSTIAHTVEEAKAFAKNVGYPVVIRPAYTLGGTGGGIASNQQELERISADGIRLSRVGQVLVEKSLEGWKELEFEVIRDRLGNSLVVCSMENIDPVGIHTGDSVVVAPAQTLKEKELSMLKKSALKIVDELGIEGGCNVQYALHPSDLSYYVIEVNPRVSRSSALASKATGYPIANISAKIAIGYTLDQILSGVDSNKTALDVPEMNHVVIKFPRWPFDKFLKADKDLGTKMKATGEVMAIGKTIEEALLKAIRSLELGLDRLELTSLKKLESDELKLRLLEKTDERLFVIAQCMRRGISIERIFKDTNIDKYFLRVLKNIVDMEGALKGLTIEKLSGQILKDAKVMGFTDSSIAHFLNVKTSDIKKARIKQNIRPMYEKINTFTTEKSSSEPYYYSTYSGENQLDKNLSKKIVVIGSGPIKIGQGIEFDYCCVHGAWALNDLGYQSIMINNNPETVSTDFDTADRLYFEPLTEEDVLNILDIESPEGVIVQFGGQTSIKLVKAISDAGYKILGTDPRSINQAEDREEFDKLLSDLNLLRPKGKTVFTTDEALEVAKDLEYPVLVRPSYVLGGQGMEIAYTSQNLIEYMNIINRNRQEHPILIDKYMLGTEIEVDAISDGVDILIPGIMEHIERAGVHSGDSISVYPPQTLSKGLIETAVDYTKKLAQGLNIKGLINIQFVYYNEELYVIEVNPRSSRTVPFMSKVTGIPMVSLATQAMLGKRLKDMGYGTGYTVPKDIVAVKVPIFSFEKLPQVEISLGPEMKSTGEILALDRDLPRALYKGLISAGYTFKSQGTALITVADHDKQEIIHIASELERLGYNILATQNTGHVLRSNYIAASTIYKLQESSPNIEDYIAEGKIDIIINTPTKGKLPQRDGFQIRRQAVEYTIPCFTSLDTAKAFLNSLKLYYQNGDSIEMEIFELGEIR